MAFKRKTRAAQKASITQRFLCYLCLSGPSTRVHPLPFPQHNTHLNNNVDAKNGRVLEGYLFKRASNPVKTWNRHWFSIEDNQLVYRKKLKDKPIIMLKDLSQCVVNQCKDIKRRFCFEVVSPTKSCMLQAESEILQQAWIRAIQNIATSSSDKSDDLEENEWKCLMQEMEKKHKAEMAEAKEREDALKLELKLLRKKMKRKKRRGREKLREAEQRKMEQMLDMAGKKESKEHYIEHIKTDVEKSGEKKTQEEKTNVLQSTVPTNRNFLGGEKLDYYFPSRQIGIYIATWNMAGRKELPDNLHDLLPTNDFSQGFYIFGVQEGCPDRREWEVRLQETLGQYYVMLYAAAHGVIYLTMFIRRDLVFFCSEVEHATVTTRIMPQIKTKGAVGISFTFFGTSFLFITSHFSVGNLHQRILNYDKTIKDLALPNQPDTHAQLSIDSDVTTLFDEVFWFGDFNFRLSQDRGKVEAILNEHTGEDIDALLQHDQLSKEMKNGSIFKGFQEAPIHFTPTYKFDIGSDVYDTSSKQRIPSYTDRILYRSRQEEDIKVVRYTSCTTIKNSDHRPVIGMFQVKLKPGTVSIPWGGLFNQAVYQKGIRQMRKLKRRRDMKNQSKSRTCSIT